ncbi:MAG: hypothetical protein PHW33_03630 [Candidatus Portnoybacteria bacterium]|nr:hypothetical protein [Candidatus Portnoybacteria bacterium]
MTQSKIQQAIASIEDAVQHLDALLVSKDFAADVEGCRYSLRERLAELNALLALDPVVCCRCGKIPAEPWQYIGEVWCQECRDVEVHVEWDVSKLSKGQRDLLHSLTRALGLLSVRFDTGGTKDRFDWEWDWSLRGPLKILFRGFTRDNPQNRYVRETETPASKQEQWNTRQQELVKLLGTCFPEEKDVQ